MWKFYASCRQPDPNARIRIILISGDRDFTDALGQLRNFGVEVGILTGKPTSVAPVYYDYSLGMRVLPLLGVIEARVRGIDALPSNLDVYQSIPEPSIPAAFDNHCATP
jgi:NYN domain